MRGPYGYQPLSCLNKVLTSTSWKLKLTLSGNCAYFFLHHMRAIPPHHLHIILNKHHVGLLCTFQHGVNANVRTSSSNTGTEKKNTNDSLTGEAKSAGRGGCEGLQFRAVKS